MPSHTYQAIVRRNSTTFQLPLLFPFTHVQVRPAFVLWPTTVSPEAGTAYIGLRHNYHCGIHTCFAAPFCPETLDGAGGKKLRHRSNLALRGQFGYGFTVSIFDMRHWISSLLKACKRWVVAQILGFNKTEKSLWVKTEDENAIHPRTVSQ